MYYHSKLLAAHEELSRAGIWKSNFNPLLFQVLRKLGMNTPPPYYRNFTLNFFTSFACFTAILGLLGWLNDWQGKSLTEGIIAALVGGALFGLIIASYYRWKFKKCKLTKWEDL
jgi:hypothetical protein